MIVEISVKVLKTQRSVTYEQCYLPLPDMLMYL